MQRLRSAALLGLGAALACGLVSREASAVKPLDKTQQFMWGELRLPTTAPVSGALPARLATLPHDTSPLPAKVWLRFQSFGGKSFAGYAAQLQIDEAGNLFVVAQLGKATAASVKQPKWPKRPSQIVDAEVMARLRQGVATLTGAPAYKGYTGLDAPTFVITVRAPDGSQHEYVFEAWEDAFIQHLRRITSFASTTPLKKTRPRR
ncbi:MAG: hypothetical protein IT370_07070 [Deltaproteobacteria bacterium]|nr:hypothetical protein [Deltaproteobacteria bacterium]